MEDGTPPQDGEGVRGDARRPLSGSWRLTTFASFRTKDKSAPFWEKEPSADSLGAPWEGLDAQAPRSPLRRGPSAADEGAGQGELGPEWGDVTDDMMRRPPGVREMVATFRAQVAHLGWMDLSITLALALLLLTSQTLVPVYMKALFNGFHGIPSYDYPLIASLLQMAAVAVVLSIVSAFLAAVSAIRGRWSRERAWGLLWGFLYVLPAAASLALVFALTNLGVASVDIDLHVVLNATNIFWVVVFAWPVQGERPSIVLVVLCVILMGGTAMVAWSAAHHGSTHVGPIILNLAAAMVAPLHVVLLRFACARCASKLPRPPSTAEIAAMEMTLAFALLTLPGVGLEWSGILELGHLAWSTALFLALGVALTLVFHLAIVAMSSRALATTVGVVVQLRVAPQIALGVLILGQAYALTPLHIVGTVVVILATVGYALYRFWKSVQTLALQARASSYDQSLIMHIQTPLLDNGAHS